MVRIQARAKINWTLDVLRRREDGYHELDMLLQSVELHDTLTLEPADTLELVIAKGPPMRVDENNLVLRAARTLQTETGVAKGARMALEKRIPIGAGMGGGSADAAAALIGLNRLWRLGLTEAELECIGLGIGADVPFCVRGGLQRACGIGERLQPLNMGRDLWLLVIQPCRGLSTRDVFTALRLEETAGVRRPKNDAAARALLAGDTAALIGAMGNVLQPVAEALRPEIAECAGRIAAQGALCAQMTGSGSAVFGVFTTARAARDALRALRPAYRKSWMTSTAGQGIVIKQE